MSFDMDFSATGGDGGAAYDSTPNMTNSSNNRRSSSRQTSHVASSSTKRKSAKSQHQSKQRVDQDAEEYDPDEANDDPRARGGSGSMRRAGSSSSLKKNSSGSDVRSSTPANKAARRLARKAEAARVSRRKKKAYLEGIETTLQDLEDKYAAILAAGGGGSGGAGGGLKKQSSLSSNHSNGTSHSQQSHSRSQSGQLQSAPALPLPPNQQQPSSFPSATGFHNPNTNQITSLPTSPSDGSAGSGSSKVSISDIAMPSSASIAAAAAWSTPGPLTDRFIHTLNSLSQVREDGLQQRFNFLKDDVSQPDIMVKWLMWMVRTMNAANNNGGIGAVGIAIKQEVITPGSNISDSSSHSQFHNNTNQHNPLHLSHPSLPFIYPTPTTLPPVLPTPQTISPQTVWQDLMHSAGVSDASLQHLFTPQLATDAEKLGDSFTQQYSTLTQLQADIEMHLLERTKQNYILWNSFSKKQIEILAHTAIKQQRQQMAYVQQQQQGQQGQQQGNHLQYQQRSGTPTHQDMQQQQHSSSSSTYPASGTLKHEPSAHFHAR